MLQNLREKELKDMKKRGLTERNGILHHHDSEDT